MDHIVINVSAGVTIRLFLTMTTTPVTLLWPSDSGVVEIWATELRVFGCDLRTLRHIIATHGKRGGGKAAKRTIMVYDSGGGPKPSTFLMAGGWLYTSRAVEKRGEDNIE